MCKSKFQICHFGIQKTGIKNFTLRIIKLKKGYNYGIIRP